MLPAQPVIYIVEPFGGSLRTHNANLPHIYFDDAGIIRGDGVFESLLVYNGQPCNLERHMKRFQRSAKLLDLPKPDAEIWKRATYQAAAEFNGTENARMTWSYTRGRAGSAVPSAWMTVKAISTPSIEERIHGLKVLTASRGYSIATGEAAAPWPTGAAKTLNYASNLAAKRWAKENSADDVIFTEPLTGQVLEATTASVLLVKPGKKLRTPSPNEDILPGTSQAAVFELAEERGWKCKEQPLSLKDLLEAESLWLVSSTRRAMRVRRLNGQKLPAPDNAAEIAELVEQALTSS